MKIIRPMVLALLHNDINFQATHIPGKDTIVCDALSRMLVSPQWMAQQGFMHRPTPIPDASIACQLWSTVNSLVRSSMQPALHKQYNHHWSMFCDFVHQLGHEQTLPANHDLIAIFVAHLHGRGLKYTTIRAYLSAISKFHKLRNHPDHTEPLGHPGFVRH